MLNENTVRAELKKIQQRNYPIDLTGQAEHYAMIVALSWVLDGMKNNVMSPSQFLDRPLIQRKDLSKQLSKDMISSSNNE